MKTKLIILAGLLFLSLTVPSVQLKAQEIHLPLTEGAEVRPKSMSLEFVYATYNSNFMTVYINNYKGTAVVSIEDEKGFVYEQVTKTIKTNGVVVVSLEDLPKSDGYYVLRVKTKYSYFAYFKM